MEGEAFRPVEERVGEEPLDEEGVEDGDEREGEEVEDRELTVVTLSAGDELDPAGRTDPDPVLEEVLQEHPDTAEEEEEGAPVEHSLVLGE